MKPYTLILLSALAPTAWGNLTPTGTTITGTGPYTWSYNLQLSNDQDVTSGFAPAVNPVPHANLTFAGFFTIYDFAGYIGGSCSGPAGWTCTAQNVGFTPDDVTPIDNPGIVNLTWAYTTGATLLGQPIGLNLGTFSAQSTFNLVSTVSYTGRGIKNIGSQAGTIADNVGNTQGPIAVPEPVTLAFTGLGLMLLGLVRTRRKPTV